MYDGLEASLRTSAAADSGHCEAEGSLRLGSRKLIVMMEMDLAVTFRIDEQAHGLRDG